MLTTRLFLCLIASWCISYSYFDVDQSGSLLSVGGLCALTWETQWLSFISAFTWLALTAVHGAAWCHLQALISQTQTHTSTIRKQCGATQASLIHSNTRGVERKVNRLSTLMIVLAVNYSDFQAEVERNTVNKHSSSWKDISNLVTVQSGDSSVMVSDGSHAIWLKDWECCRSLSVGTLLASICWFRLEHHTGAFCLRSNRLDPQGRVKGRSRRRLKYYFKINSQVLAKQFLPNFNALNAQRDVSIISVNS